MGTLSGANIQGQTANPMDELDFQVGNKLRKMSKSIEKTFIQGTYNKATSDDEINKTRGLVEAIKTNEIKGNGKPINIWTLNDLVRKIHDNQGDTGSLTLWADNVTINQIHGDAIEKGVEMGDFMTSEYGIRIRDIMLPSATVHIVEGRYIPAGTALLLNLGVISPVEQLTPDKGNFFLEELAKQGAGTQYQLFGQIGLDYANELYHGKITGLSTEFTPPEGRKVVMVSAQTP